MLQQRGIYMDTCISNIFFIIVKNYCKDKRSETEVAESIRRFIYPKIATLHFFEQSGIAPICVTYTIRAVWTGRLSAAKLVSEWHLFAKESVNMVISIIYLRIV